MTLTLRWSAFFFPAAMMLAAPQPLVLQTDFGVKDGAVAAMRGVASGVDARLPLRGVNSLMNVAFALNVGDFARTHSIGSGAQWTVRLEKARK